MWLVNATIVMNMNDCSSSQVPGSRVCQITGKSSEVVQDRDTVTTDQ